MAEIQFADIGNALAQGAQARLLTQQANLEDRRGAMQPDIAAAVGGDNQAFGRIAAADPRTAAAIAPVLARLDARQAAKVKEAADYTVGVGMGILNAPTGSRGALYDAAKADAAKRGMDTASWPTAYDEGWLKFNIGKAIPAKTWFEEQGKNARRGAAGGGGSSIEPLGGGATAPTAPAAPRVAEVAPAGAPPVQMAGMPGEGVAQGDSPTADASGTPLPPGQVPLGKFWPTDPALKGGVMMQDRKRPGVPAEQNGHFIYKLPTGEIVLHKPREEKPPRALPPGYEENPNGGGLRPIVGGPEDVETLKAKTEAKRRADEKAIPGTAAKGMQENVNNLKQVDRALQALDKNPGSIGGLGSTAASVVPGVSGLQNRYGDPEGTDLRAQIANIGSLLIHDRSGAAVTASETPRLMPFIPLISDAPEVAKKKLNNFKITYEEMLRDATAYYGPANGFREYTPATSYLNGKETAPVGAEKAREDFNAKKGGAPAAPAPAQNASPIAEGATATNAQTGERVIFSGGKWMPTR